MSSLARSKRWEVVEADPQVSARIEQLAGVSPLVARIMAGRGITDPEDVMRFLSPSLDRDWSDPALIPGLTEVVDRLWRALVEGERIAVFGDFDVDGISATCLLTRALRELGGEVVPFIPRRFDEGYGLSRAALDRLVEMAHPDLIVTVDTGIAARTRSRCSSRRASPWWSPTTTSPPTWCRWACRWRTPSSTPRAPRATWRAWASRSR